jgi:hypothetical protein
MFGINNKDKKAKFIGPKAMNRKQLLTQNLIFVIIAVIIIIILTIVVISNLTFLLDKINKSLKVFGTGEQIPSFNIGGLDMIKDKLTTPTPEISPTPNSTSTAPVISSFATTTPSIFPSSSPAENP